MITQDQVRDIIGKTVRSTSGDKLGEARQVFLDDVTNEPEWVTVNTGMFGTKETFVPLADARVSGDAITVPYSKDKVKDAPTTDVGDGHLDESEELVLYAHYGLDYSEKRSDSGLPARDRDNDGAMTRSEEQLRADKEKVPAGKARLRKYVETEQEQVTVPVTKEKARLETEPITDANRDDALAGRDISGDEHEVTLTEERPVVQKEAVPVERVRLGKDVEQTQETVTADVRKERIETDSDVDVRADERSRGS